MILNYKSLGHGKPVVILHGLFGMLDNWLSIGKQLAQSCSVYLVDLRNHGKSSHTPDHSYALMSADIAAFLEQHHLDNASIIGHSMGGKVAMHLAFERPDLFDKLVIIDIAPKAYLPQHTAVIEAMLSIDPPASPNRRSMLLSLQGYLYDPRLVGFIMKNLARDRVGGFHWKMNLPVLVENYHAINIAITGEPFAGETLFVRGSESEYILDSDWRDILALFPAAQLETVTDAGHWVHADRPEALLGILRAFLG